MAASVARLPGNPPGDGIPPVELYKIAVDEYRFQAQYNWSRTQYLLGFNAAVLVAATAVAAQPGRGAALVFLFGSVVACLSIVVVRTQHDYYRAARDHMRRVEQDCAIADAQRLDTTASLGKRGRTVSVNQVVYLLLVAVALADLVGAFLIFIR